MEVIIATLTDTQRVNALTTIYKKGLSTPKTELAFSADKMVYVKPFLTKLQNDPCQATKSLANLVLVREVIDELLNDIMDEVEATCSKLSEKRAQKLSVEYGLTNLIQQSTEDFNYVKQVA